MSNIKLEANIKTIKIDCYLRSENFTFDHKNNIRLGKNEVNIRFWTDWTWIG